MIAVIGGHFSYSGVSSAAAGIAKIYAIVAVFLIFVALAIFAGDAIFYGAGLKTLVQ